MHADHFIYFNGFGFQSNRKQLNISMLNGVTADLASSFQSLFLYMTLLNWPYCQIFEPLTTHNDCQRCVIDTPDHKLNSKYIIFYLVT